MILTPRGKSRLRQCKDISNLSATKGREVEKFGDLRNVLKTNLVHAVVVLTEEE